MKPDLDPDALEEPQEFTREFPTMDRGVRRFVERLRSQGVETYESCEGGHGHAFPEPTIRFFGNHVAGFHAYAIARDFGLPVAELRRFYSVNDGELVGPQWEMTFSRKNNPTGQP